MNNFFPEVNINQLVCTVIVGIGLFISLEPKIFNTKQECSASGGSGLQNAESDLPPYVWSSIYVLGFVFEGVGLVLTERELKVKKVRHNSAFHDRFSSRRGN